MRKQFLFGISVLLAVSLSGATLAHASSSAFKNCTKHYDERLLPGEKTPPSGQATLLVSACMDGVDQVGPQVMTQGTPEQKCSALFNDSMISPGASDISQQVFDVLQLNEACLVGARDYVHEQLYPFESFDPEKCKAIRGKNGLNPELPCD